MSRLEPERRHTLALPAPDRETPGALPCPSELIRDGWSPSRSAARSSWAAPGWSCALGGYAETHGAKFVLYFQSTRGANWRLDDPASRRAWSAKVAER
ncbi:MAG: hypothetical protein WA966_10950, partial [Ornithinimicrobium sp.]